LNREILNLTKLYATFSQSIIDGYAIFQRAERISVILMTLVVLYTPILLT